MDLDRDLCSIQETRNLVRAAKKAEEVLKTFTQEQVDRICEAMVKAGVDNSCHLAQMAITETGMGKYEDKCFKNYFASHYLWEYIKDMKTAGIIREDQVRHVWDIAEPMGVIAGIVPTTNPTSTTIYKAIIAMKSRNTIVFSPHPSAVRCTVEAAKIMNDAAVRAGAPEGCVGCISLVSMGATNELMKHPDTAVILATGGGALVRAAYSSGKPALGVGPGNVPAFVERSADLKRAANDIVTGKSFDNGTICASEQAVVAEECIADELIAHMKNAGAYFMNAEDTKKVSDVTILPGGAVNPKIVGKDPQFIGKLCGINVPDNARCLVAFLDGVGPSTPLSYEKLSTVLGFYRVRDWHEGCERCLELVNLGGIGHSLAIHSNNMEIIRDFALKKPIFRILVNTASTLGGVGATTGLAPSFTLGSGTWGGSAISENVSPLHLLNMKHVAWPIRELERPPIVPMSEAGSQVPAPAMGDRQVIEEIVSQVMRAMRPTS